MNESCPHFAGCQLFAQIFPHAKEAAASGPATDTPGALGMLVASGNMEVRESMNPDGEIGSILSALPKPCDIAICPLAPLIPKNEEP